VGLLKADTSGRPLISFVYCAVTTEAVPTVQLIRLKDGHLVNWTLARYHSNRAPSEVGHEACYYRNATVQVQHHEARA
jgi:hypothetical protein